MNRNKRRRADAMANGRCAACYHRPMVLGLQRCQSCHNAMLSAIKRWRDKIHNNILNAYGRQCSCCGESTVGFLTVEHTEAVRHLKKESGAGEKLYRWLHRNNYPPGFTILCYNCNCGSAANGGRCPHNG